MRAAAFPHHGNVVFVRQASDPMTLWRNPAVPDRLREGALREIFGRFDINGPEIVAAYPQTNENAWLLGLVGARAAVAYARSDGTGRGERASASLTQQSLRFLMINRTPRDLLPATARSA